MDRAAKKATTSTTDVPSPNQVEKKVDQPDGSPLPPRYKCQWEGCRSRAVFKNKSLLNEHIRNVHSQPLVCAVAECSHKSPFSRKSDLRRHQRSVHSTERGFVCSVPSCDAHIKEFTRKDHLTKHMRDLHDNYFCSLRHCPRETRQSFAKSEDLARHIENEHGDFECAIQGCAIGLSSKFTRVNLKYHLRNHHGVFFWGTSDIINRMLEDASKTVMECHLNQIQIPECKICKKSGDTLK
jgi:hypothetical protein